MHEVASTCYCSAFLYCCNKTRACLTVVCTYISIYMPHLLMKMDNTRICQELFSIMCFTCKMYFYFSQRLGKLPCGGSIAIDSSGMATAEWMVGCSPCWLVWSHWFYPAYILCGVLNQIRNREYAVSHKCVWVCVYVREREWETTCYCLDACACICRVHGFHTDSFFILHLLPLRDCGVSDAFRVYISLIPTRQLPSNHNADPGVNPQLQACNQTHLFILL